MLKNHDFECVLIYPAIKLFGEIVSDVATKKLYVDVIVDKLNNFVSL